MGFWLVGTLIVLGFPQALPAQDPTAVEALPAQDPAAFEAPLAQDPAAFEALPVQDPDALEVKKASVEGGGNGQMVDELLGKIDRKFWDEMRRRLLLLKRVTRKPIVTLAGDSKALMDELEHERARNRDFQFLAWILTKEIANRGASMEVDNANAKMVRTEARTWEASAKRFDMVEAMELDFEQKWVVQAEGCKTEVDGLKAKLALIDTEMKKINGDDEFVGHEPLPPIEVPSSIPAIPTEPQVTDQAARSGASLRRWPPGPR